MEAELAKSQITRVDASTKRKKCVQLARLKRESVERVSQLKTKPSTIDLFPSKLLVDTEVDCDWMIGSNSASKEPGPILFLRFFVHFPAHFKRIVWYTTVHTGAMHLRYVCRTFKGVYAGLRETFYIHTLLRASLLLVQFFETYHTILKSSGLLPPQMDHSSRREFFCFWLASGCRG